LSDCKSVQVVRREFIFAIKNVHSAQACRSMITSVPLSRLRPCHPRPSTVLLRSGGIVVIKRRPFFRSAGKGVRSAVRCSDEVPVESWQSADKPIEQVINGILISSTNYETNNSLYAPIITPDSTLSLNSSSSRHVCANLHLLVYRRPPHLPLGTSHNKYCSKRKQLFSSGDGSLLAIWKA
jgi:hypothetical protein